MARRLETCSDRRAQPRLKGLRRLRAQGDRAALRGRCGAARRRAAGGGPATPREPCGPAATRKAQSAPLDRCGRRRRMGRKVGHTRAGWTGPRTCVRASPPSDRRTAFRFAGRCAPCAREAGVHAGSCVL